MARDRGTGVGLFLVEIDGIPEFRALSVTGGVETTAPTAIPNGGGTNSEHKVRGNTTVEELTITVAAGMFEPALRAIRAWRRDCRNGSMLRRNVRRVQLDETGRTPISTIQYLDCWPTSVSPTDNTARGDEPASWTIVLAVDAVED
jgi:phage tail-like protein